MARDEENNRKRWAKCASQSQQNLEPVEQPQPLRKRNLIIQRLIRTASGEADRMIDKIFSRRTRWVNNGRIFTEGSREVVKFRAELETQGKVLPDNTILCIHAKRTNKGITVTTQGTFANYNVQKYIMKWCQDYFEIDGQSVTAGNSHENDHIFFTNTASVSNLRHSNSAQDRGLTVKLPKEIHALRTNNPALSLIAFELKNLTEELPVLLEPLRKADEGLWLTKKHATCIARGGLTPSLLVERYNH